MRRLVRGDGTDLTTAGRPDDYAGSRESHKVRHTRSAGRGLSSSASTCFVCLELRAAGATTSSGTAFGLPAALFDPRARERWIRLRAQDERRLTAGHRQVDVRQEPRVRAGARDNRGGN